MTHFISTTNGCRLSLRSFLSLALCMLLLLAPSSGCSAKNVTSSEFDEERNRLIAYILWQELPTQHFSHEPLGDSLSRKAYDLYVRQLDPRKRFLLQEDMKKLGAYATRIDDELKHGEVRLPDVGMRMLNNRIRQAKTMIDPILDAGFDYHHEESIEGDPKKLAFAANMSELKERWRISLKLQVIDAYLGLLDKNEKDKPKTLAEAEPSLHPEQMKEAIRKVREQNHRGLSRLLQQSRQDHFDRYFDAIARAFDPHTDYMAPDTKEDFDIQMTGSLEGIGALLREDEGLIKVVRIIPGSAAERQGQLQAEDTILSAAEKNGEPVEFFEMRIREAVRYIRGRKGTEVHLRVQKPDGSRTMVPIVRDVVQIEETWVKSTILTGDKGKKVGYISIPSFYRDFKVNFIDKDSRNATDDTREHLLKLKKQNISGLILDLRNNGGGALVDAVQIAGLFLPAGPMVQVKDANGEIRVLSDDSNKVVYDGPVIVLVNQFSASAAEILAAALQDYGRAFIIGSQHTHGKGTVQALMDINRNLPLLHLRRYDDFGALKLTIQKFYRINGGSTQFKGVEPDLTAPSMFDSLKTGEKHMDYALSWDQVPPLTFKRWQGVRFPVEKTRQAGERWVAGDPMFARIAKESAKAKVRNEQTATKISLQAVWDMREDLATARKEAQEIGLVDEDDLEDGTSVSNTSKDMDKKLIKDPFVLLSLHLVNSAARFQGTAQSGR